MDDVVLTWCSWESVRWSCPASWGGARVRADAYVVRTAEGLDGLTMRALATAIGSEPMSLHRHVSSKDDLLAGMVDAVAGGVEVPGDEATFTDAVAAIAHGAADALRRHPWAAARWLRGPLGPGRTALMQSLLAALHRSGRPHDVVDRGFHAVVNHVVGSGIAWAASGDGPDGTGPVELDAYPHLAAHVAHHRDRADEGPDPFTSTLDAVLRAVDGDPAAGRAEALAPRRAP